LFTVIVDGPNLNWLGDRTARFAADGTYHVSNLPCSSYFVRVDTRADTAVGIEPRSHYLNLSDGRPGIADFAFDGHTTSGTGHCQIKGRITGYADMARFVAIFKEHTGELVSQTRVGSDGSYLMSNVPPGRYTVRPLHESAWRDIDELIAQPSSKVVTCTSGSISANFRVTSREIQK